MSMRSITGKNINLCKFTYDMFNIKDVAYSLANEKRFSNQTSPLYSVAQHSLFVSHLLFPVGAGSMHDSLAGLMHDASESYIRDLNSSFKKEAGMEFYRQKEEEIQDAVYYAAGVDKTKVNWERLHKTDMESRNYELLFFRGEWSDNFKPVRSTIELFKNTVKMSPQETEIEFIARYLFLKAPY